MTRKVFVGLLSAFAAWTSVATFAADPVKQPKLLSEAGLYEDVAARKFAPGLMAFSPQYPLWSDHAAKARWIQLPEGTVIDTTNPDKWVFPVGTKFWKEFSYKTDGGTTKVETRLMVKTAKESSSWKFYTYVWNDDQTDANLDVLGKGKEEAFETGKDTYHDVPNRADCMACHSHDGEPVLGFGALQLSWDRDPLSPHQEKLQPFHVTLKELQEKKLVSKNVEKAPRIHAATPEARAVYGYLHSNCGGCHSPGGHAAFTNMIVWHELGDLRDETERPAYKSMVNVRTVRFTDVARRLVGGDPKNSALLVRMKAEGRKFPKMPNLGTSQIDEDAVKLIAKWIEGLPKP